MHDPPQQPGRRVSILRQGATLESALLVDRLAADLRPGGPLQNLAGTVEAIELIVQGARGTVLADLERFVAFEIRSPRTGSLCVEGMWPSTDGFYLTATAARFEQVLDSVQALTVLLRAGAHRAGWAVLEQAGRTLGLLWIFTETLVQNEPWDEARRSGRAWVAFTDALADVDGVAGFEPHPFDTAHTDEPGVDFATTIDRAVDGASDQAKNLVEAIRLGITLAQVHLPAHLQIDPDTVSTMPTAGTGLDSAEMVTALIELAIALVCSAAASTAEALRVSMIDRAS